MALQFGIGNMYAGPSGSETEFGCLQGITIDFSYDRATLHCGAGLYPTDIRIHTATITGRASYAELSAATFYKALGGYGYSNTDTKIVIMNTTAPYAFRMRCLNVTDAVTMIVLFEQCRTDSFSFNMERTSYVIPDFGFTMFADTTGKVGEIELGDAS